MTHRLFLADLHQYATAPAALHLLPLLPAGILAVSLEFPTPPLLAAVVVGFLALEPRFNDMLYHTPRDFRAHSLLPVPPATLVKARNMAAIILSALAAVVTAAIFIFFARTPFVPRQAGEAVLFFASMVFTLLHAGNGRSVQFPRRVTGWRLDDLIEGIGFLVTIAMLAIPYLVLAAAMDMEWLCWLYAAFTAVHWWVRSIPRTASLITERQTALCSGMPTLWKSGT